MTASPQFIFLGTGTSGGIPIIACSCEACTSTDPRDQRTRSGAAVQWIDGHGKPRTALLDATPDLRQQALRHNLTRCDAILFTHNHVDHIFGLDETRRFCAVMGRELGIGPIPLDIFADAHTMAALQRVYKHIFERDGNINDSFVASLIAHTIRPFEPLLVHGLSFTPIKLLHGKLPILGFRIDVIDRSIAREDDSPFPLAYCTDVSAIPPETWPYLNGLNTLILDGLRFRHHPTHFTIDQAIHHALEIGARQTFLTHIAHEIVHAKVDPDLPEGINLAYDGLVLTGETRPAAPPGFTFEPRASERDPVGDP